MEWVETTGRTLEEARSAALQMLGVGESDAEFVTLNEPRPGLFGKLRGGPARVRARVMPTTPPPKRTRSRRPTQKRSGSGSQQTAGRAASATKTAVGAAEQRLASQPQDSARDGQDGGGATKRKRRRPSGARGKGLTGAANEPETSAGVSPTDGDPALNGADPAEGDSKPGVSATKPRRRRRSSAKVESQPEEEAVTETLSPEEQGEIAKEFIEGLVAQLGLDATVTATPADEDSVQVAVEGDELGLLVGQGGSTLAALQELARTVVQRKTSGHTERILVDVAGYRARRAEALGRFTRKIVDQVLETGREKALEAMSPADRKIVHDAVNEMGGAVTRSEGVEPHRYVVISPAGETDSASAAEDGSE